MEPEFSRKASGAYDYRTNGVEYAISKPVAYQPRLGGPPLLFVSDVRATLLVTLALHGGSIRLQRLWEHLGARPRGALIDLVDTGLVTMWRLSRGKVFAALDPAHPAAPSIRRLLVRIGQLYGFQVPKYHADNELAGLPPLRRSRRRDVRTTFGYRHRTIPLLLLHIFGEANAAEVARCVPGLEAGTVRSTFWMFGAFGILKYDRRVKGKSRGFAFQFDERNVFHHELSAVLAELDAAMPQWRIVAQRQSDSVAKTVHELRRGRRKPGRWKW